MALIPKCFLDAVVALGNNTVNEKGNPQKQWIGTGFLVGKKESEIGETIYLITNKHVVENQKTLIVKFNSKDNSKTKEYSLDLIGNNGETQFSIHKNSKIDIAVISINPNVIISDNASLKYFELENHSTTLQEMQNTGIDEGTLVYAMGFPMNLVGDKRKSPICRLGCISRISDLFANKDELIFLVDAQTFPGNSGGPIVSRPESMSIENTVSNSKANLIGILSAYIPYKEVLVSLQTGEMRSVMTENSGLTVVFPVDFIKEVVEIEKMRVETLINSNGISNDK